MCGAFSILHPFKELGRPFNAGYNGPEFSGKPMARPGEMLPVIDMDNPDSIKLMKWGYKPEWKKTTGAIINTRKESLEEKPFYKNALSFGRCLIPADGFYEWQGEPGQKKAYLFTLKNKEIFAFAGLWFKNNANNKPAFTPLEAFVKKTNNKMKLPNYNTNQSPILPLTGFTIVTTPPNNLVAKIHNRMPAILPINREKLWLEPAIENSSLLNLLEPFPAELMECLSV